MKILLIADDLTGALDSSVAFKQRGIAVLCALRPEAVSAAITHDPDVVAVTTNSREILEIEAVTRIEQVLSQIRQHDGWREAILFKKVDSRLKGNVAAEVAHLAQERADVLVCPAIPRLGRFVKNGAICGAGVGDPIPVAERVGAGRVPDAQSDAEIDTALARTGSQTLFVGAAGLAEALARRLVPDARPPEPPRLFAPALFAIGSRDPVTLAQLHPFTPIPAPNGAVPAPTQENQPLHVIQMVPGSDRIEPARAGAAFAEGIARWVRATGPATLLASGGESAAAIARHLGASLFKVEGEALPGLPVSRMIDGEGALRIVTKSGGFGSPDTLETIAEMLVSSTGKPE